MVAPQHLLLKRLWPVWIAIGFPVLLVALNSTPIASNFVFVMIGIPALLGVWACLGTWALVLTVRGVRHRDWSRAVVTAVLPLVILVAGARLQEFIHFCNYAGDVAYFIVKRPFYLKEISAAPQNREPLLLAFNRGGMSWASRGYVYDESDELMHEESLRSPGWKRRADNTELSCGYYAQPFPGNFSFVRHWYVASFIC